jgi:predicted amidohydrolase YtcJ
MLQNKRSQSPRQTLGLFITLLAGSTVYAQSPSLQDVAGLAGPKPETTTIYAAKEFITMDAKLSRAEAVAVRDGRFIAVGKLADVQAAAGKHAKLDRTFADKIVIAGFVEQHVHPVLAALTMNTKVISIEDWDAIDGFSPAVRDPKRYAERLKKAFSEHSDKSKPFITWGYHHYLHGALSRATLNKLAPDSPVIVWHRSCHEFFLNDHALKLTGIDEKLIARLPKSAQEQIDYEKGHFYEQGMMGVLDKVAPFMASPAAFKNGLEYSVKYYHRNGITVCCEPGGFVSRPVQDLINSVYSGDDVPFNHYFMVDGKTFAARHPRDAKALVSDSEQVLSWGKGRTAYLPNRSNCSAMGPSSASSCR